MVKDSHTIRVSSVFNLWLISLGCGVGPRYAFPVFAGAAIFAFGLGAATASRAADTRTWELSPYRIQLQIATDTAAQPRADLSDQLVAVLRDRIQSTLYPLWSVDIDIATGPRRHQLLTQLASLTEESLGGVASRYDKQMFLCVKASVVGYVVQCREFDVKLHRWGTVRQRIVPQQWLLADQCLDLLRDTFAPLATIRPIDEEPQHVTLRFKGSGLPRQTDESLFARPGDVLQPLIVRMTGAGEVREGGVAPIPWTQLQLVAADKGEVSCQVHTGIRRPFGVRRRAGVEHLAIALRHAPGVSRVRFYARHNKSQGLAGYEVFRRESADGPSQPLGRTDSNGTIMIAPGTSSVATLFLRSDGQLLAKLPVAPGAAELLEVPIADDTARLRAQASLTSLREQLIDVVARRRILITRIRDRVEQGKLGEAQSLLSQLDDLPSRAKFDQMISSVENSAIHRSDDPKIQARIERLFADTRKLLGPFLNTREITNVQAELNAARRDEAG